MRAFKRLNDNVYELNVSLNEHGGNGENCVHLQSSLLGTHCEIFCDFALSL